MPSSKRRNTSWISSSVVPFSIVVGRRHRRIDDFASRRAWSTEVREPTRDFRQRGEINCGPQCPILLVPVSGGAIRRDRFAHACFTRRGERKHLDLAGPSLRELFSVPLAPRCTFLDP